MPNHVYNLVRMKNIAEKDIFSTEDPGCIDFNKLVRMPEVLDVPESSNVSLSIKAYVLYLRQQIVAQQTTPYSITFSDTMKLQDTLMSIPDETIKKFQDDVDKYIEIGMEPFLRSRAFKFIDKDLQEQAMFYNFAEMGRRYLENLFLNGALTWYGWSVKNWGTKWNAYDGNIIDNDTIEYYTAWNPAIPILIELSKQNPMNEIKLAYMSEDPSCAGKMTFYNGEVIQDDEYDYMSYESIELGKQLLGYNYATDMYVYEMDESPNAFTLINNVKE